MDCYQVRPLATAPISPESREAFSLKTDFRSRRFSPLNGFIKSSPDTTTCLRFDGIYSTAVMLWAFLGQVLRDGKEASCQSAVAHVVSYCLKLGKSAPTSDTGDYCRARAKLSEHAHSPTQLRRCNGNGTSSPGALALEVVTPEVDRRFHLHDARYRGEPSRVSTAEGTEAGPGTAHRSRRYGLVAGNRLRLDAAIGPYQGKQTGENGAVADHPAVLWQR